VVGAVVCGSCAFKTAFVVGVHLLNYLTGFPGLWFKKFRDMQKTIRAAVVPDCGAEPEVRLNFNGIVAVCDAAGDP
jgi:hypothetical protein